MTESSFEPAAVAAAVVVVAVAVVVAAVVTAAAGVTGDLVAAAGRCFFCSRKLSI